MEILTRGELRQRFQEICEKIKGGAIFIHPTDTIYGLSCNALDEQAVQKIRTIKGKTTPLSVWVPSLTWIQQNCQANHLEKLPGPYTLILKLNKQAVAREVTEKSIGVRLPDHWFAQVVEKIGVPLVTTSANRSGEAFMTCLENLDPLVEQKVEFIIYEGPKERKPSTIIDGEMIVRSFRGK